MVESESAELEALRSPHGAAHCHLPEDHEDPEGEVLRPGPSGGGDRVGVSGTTV